MRGSWEKWGCLFFGEKMRDFWGKGGIFGEKMSDFPLKGGIFGVKMCDFREIGRASCRERV